MLPVVRGDRETARQIVLYSLGLVAFTLAVGPGSARLYTVAALCSADVPLARVASATDLSRGAALLFHYSLRTSRCSSSPPPSTRWFA